jgi:protein-tyrosine-phosphatase
LAEVLLRQEVAAAWGVPQVELDALGWTIESAGTSVISASPANGNSVAAASEVGLDLSSHRSQNLELALQKPWDLVLGMSATHLGLLPPNTPCALFDPTGGEVPDPFGQEMSIYRLTRDHLQEACLGWAQSWSRWPESGQTYVTAGG